MTRSNSALSRVRVGVVMAVTIAASTLGVMSTRGSAGAATPDASPGLVAASELAAYVPLDHRGFCARVDPEEFEGGAFSHADALLYCAGVTEDVDSVLYVKYGTLEALQQAYTNQIPADIATGESGTPCPVETTWSYDGEGGGSDACFTDTATDGDGQSVEIAKMVWTAEDQLILGFAIDDEGDADMLKEWWSDNSGPLQEPDRKGLTPLTEAAWAKDGKRLIAALPAAATKCKVLDNDFDESLKDQEDPSYAYAAYLATEVDCSVPKGSVRWSQLSPETALQFLGYLRLYVYDSGYPDLKKPAVCDDTTDVKVGKKTVGKMICWYNQETLWVGWYNEKTGLVGSYVTSRSPADALKYAKANLVS